MSDPAPLVSAYDVVLLDLDGVVYVGERGVPHVAKVLASLREHGPRLAYVTNNASRPPEQVAERIVSFGVDAGTADVVTAAQATARLVAEHVPAGAPVLLVGGQGLRESLLEHGLRVVSTADARPAAVVQGFSADLDWASLAEGAYAIQAGVPWYASNTDRTLPTPRGPAPGNGAFVAALEAATGHRPVVAGKPEPALFNETLVRVGGSRPLVVGDRLDTDIEGANRIGADSVCVLTGVSDLAQVAAAPSSLRPTYVVPDLRALLRPAPVVDRDDGWWVCGGGAVQVHDDQIEVAGLPDLAGDAAYDLAVGILQAAAAASWDARDGGRGDVSDVSAAATAVRNLVR